MTATPARSAQGEIGALARDSAHYFLGLVGTLALGVISFPLFTRILPVADYGLIDLAQKILLVVTAVSKLGLQNSALRFYNAREFAANPSLARGYYSTMFFGTVGPALVFACVFGGGVLFSMGSTTAAASTLLISALLVVPRSVQSMFWSFLRIEERTKTYNVLIVVMKAATIIAICVLIRWTPASSQLYFGATTAVEAAMVAGLTIPLLRRGLLAFSSFDPALFRAAFSFGAPLIINEAAFIVLDAADRMLVQHYLGSTELGLYAVAYGLASMVQNLLMTPLNLAVLPMYMRLWAAGEREKTVAFLSAGLEILLFGIAGLFVVVAATSHELVLLAASSKYRDAGRLIPPIFAGLILFTTYVFVNAGLMIEKKTGRLAGVMALSAVVNVALNCALLPRMGLAGAAWATFISYAFCILLLAAVSFRSLPLQVQWKRLGGYAAAAAVAWAAAESAAPASALARLLLRSMLSAGVYVAGVCLVDARVRGWVVGVPGICLELFKARRPVSRC